MKIKEVNNSQEKRDFLNVPRKIYQHDPLWISHLENDIEDIFNPKKNQEFAKGAAKRWVLWEGNNLIGRVAAFFRTGDTTGGVGFFECIDDQTAANLLFDTATHWLKGHGVLKVQGPINFGERDKYWGLLVEGFKQPSYQENYNLPYYQSLFETYGFEMAFEQTTSETDPVLFNREKFGPLAQRVIRNPEFEIRHFEMSKMNQYAEDFVTVYNQAWKQHDHFSPLTVPKIKKMFQAMKPILREDLLWFTYADGKPVAFYISIIDVNQWFKYVNGKLNWWGKIKFLWAKTTVKVTRIRGIVFGVVPEYQGRGLYAGMIMKIFNVFQSDPHLKSTELAWIGDFNPRMHALFKALGAVKSKIHWTMEKVLN